MVITPLPSVDKSKDLHGEEAECAAERESNVCMVLLRNEIQL